MHSLGIVQWNSTRRDHLGNPGGVSGSGPVSVWCSINYRGDMVRSTFVGVDGGLGSMGHRPR